MRKRNYNEKDEPKSCADDSHPFRSFIFFRHIRNVCAGERDVAAY